MYFTWNEKRAAVLLCVLAVLGAALKWKLARRELGTQLPFKPAVVDSADLGRLFRGLQQRKLLLDVNTADLAALERINGIGPELARRILRERSRGGPFKDAQDLAARVKGIGEVTAARLARYLNFQDTTTTGRGE